MPDEPTDLALVLGGDGSILTALRTYAGRGVPVFALNFGEIGFLATVERRAFDEYFGRFFFSRESRAARGRCVAMGSEPRF